LCDCLLHLSDRFGELPGADKLFPALDLGDLAHHHLQRLIPEWVGPIIRFRDSCRLFRQSS